MQTLADYRLTEHSGGQLLVERLEVADGLSFQRLAIPAFVHCGLRPAVGASALPSIPAFFPLPDRHCGPRSERQCSGGPARRPTVVRRCLATWHLGGLGIAGPLDLALASALPSCPDIVMAAATKITPETGKT